MPAKRKGKKPPQKGVTPKRRGKNTGRGPNRRCTPAHPDSPSLSDEGSLVSASSSRKGRIRSPAPPKKTKRLASPPAKSPPNRGKPRGIQKKSKAGENKSPLAKGKSPRAPKTKDEERDIDTYSTPSTISLVASSDEGSDCRDGSTPEWKEVKRERKVTIVTPPHKSESSTEASILGSSPKSTDRKIDLPASPNKPDARRSPKAIPDEYSDTLNTHSQSAISTNVISEVVDRACSPVRFAHTLPSTSTQYSDPQLSHFIEIKAGSDFIPKDKLNFDHNHTGTARFEVANQIAQALKENWPNSENKALLTKAQESMAKFIGAPRPKNVMFLIGMRSAVAALTPKGSHVVVAIGAAQHWAGELENVTTLARLKTTEEDVLEAVRPDTALVVMGLTCPVTGALLPLSRIIQRLKELPHRPLPNLLCDLSEAVAAGFLEAEYTKQFDFDFAAFFIDGPALGAPRGVAAVYLPEGVAAHLPASATPCPATVVGLGFAASLPRRLLSDTPTYYLSYLLKKHLARELVVLTDCIELETLPNTCSLMFLRRDALSRLAQVELLAPNLAGSTLESDTPVVGLSLGPDIKREHIDLLVNQLREAFVEK